MTTVELIKSGDALALELAWLFGYTAGRACAGSSRRLAPKDQRITARPGE